MVDRSTSKIVYGIDDRPPPGEAIALGFQHVVAMLLGNITPPLLICGALGLAVGDTALVLQAVLMMAGLATVVQAYPIGPIGGRINSSINVRWNVLPPREVNKPPPLRDFARPGVSISSVATCSKIATMPGSSWFWKRSTNPGRFCLNN